MGNEARKTTVISVRGMDRDELLRDPNFRYVGRAVPRAGWKASPYGNPFVVGMTWEDACKTAGSLVTPAPYERLAARNAVDWFAHFLPTQPSLVADLPGLKGKVLGCWCGAFPCEGEPEIICHAVVLARLADAAPDPVDRETVQSLDTTAV